MNTSLSPHWIDFIIKRYRSTMNELDMIFLRVIAITLTIVTTILAIAVVPHAIHTLGSATRIITEYVCNPQNKTVVYHIILSVWLLICT